MRRLRHQKEEMYPFVQELLGIFPNSVYHSRKGFPIKAICESAVRHAFTDLMILHEDAGSLSAYSRVAHDRIGAYVHVVEKYRPGGGCVVYYFRVC